MQKRGQGEFYNDLKLNIFSASTNHQHKYWGRDVPNDSPLFLPDCHNKVDDCHIYYYNLVMDLSFLIPSRIRRRVLEFFVDEPDAQISIRELARQLKESPQQVYRELLNMENLGFLFSSKQGNQRVFRLNKRFFLLPAIQSLFERYKAEQNRTYEIDRVYNLDERIQELKKIPVPQELTLQTKRKKPRAYGEEKILKRHEEKS